MADPMSNILEPGLADYAANYSWVNNCLPVMSDLLNLTTSSLGHNIPLPSGSGSSSSYSPSPPISPYSSFPANSSSTLLSSPASPSITSNYYNFSNCNSTLSSLDDPFEAGYSNLVLEFTKILYGIVCLVGLCGNTLVIYVVLRFSKMQTVTNMYIFNLALADEMFLVGLPFLIVTVKYQSWPFGQIMCQIYMITTSINQFTSSLLLTVMSADRYIAVCHPISSQRFRTPFIAKFICLTVWTVSALLMVPIFMYTVVLHHGPRNTLSCNIVFPENEYMNGQRAFTLYSFTLGFFIPFILIFLFYLLVICKLRKVGPKNKSKEKKRSHRKVTYLVLTVITVYVACWLPYWIGQVYIAFQEPNVRHSDLGVCILLVAGCLSYANSAVNPILYAFLSDNFKKSFAKAFTCAAGKEVNAALHVENSVFPKTTRGSTKGGFPFRSNRGSDGGAGLSGCAIRGLCADGKCNHQGGKSSGSGGIDGSDSGGRGNISISRPDGGLLAGESSHIVGEAATFVNLIAAESNIDDDFDDDEITHKVSPMRESHEFISFDQEPTTGITYLGDTIAINGKSSSFNGDAGDGAGSGDDDQQHLIITCKTLSSVRNGLTSNRSSSSMATGSVTGTQQGSNLDKLEATPLERFFFNYILFFSRKKAQRAV